MQQAQHLINKEIRKVRQGIDPAKEEKLRFQKEVIVQEGTKKVRGDFPEATPIRKEVNDAVLIHCTGLILISEHKKNALVFLLKRAN